MKMIYNAIINILKNKVWHCRIKFVRNSGLFINGAKATEHFVYITPHIEFPEQLKQKEVLQDQLTRRKTNVDLKKIENLWAVYQELKTKKLEFEIRKEEISRELGKCIKNEPNNDVTNKQKIQISLLKDDIKKLKIPLWSAEEAAIVEVLRLPNNLHNKTPDGENKILYMHVSPPNNKKDHLQIGKKLNIIDFKKNENYYLTGDAAIFELGAKFYLNSLLKKNNFIQFSNPDFVKSVIVEGCGTDHTNPDSTFILHHNENTKVNKDSRLHLTGGGSLYSYWAFHAKNVLFAKALPLKYFSMGRQYVPSPSDEDSLFHVSQSSVIEIFGLTKTADDLDKLLEEVIDVLKCSFVKLGYHFRLSIVPADMLFMWESLRVIVEMYSTSLESYVEVGNVSISGDFISKRLMLTYVENKQSKFPHIISGTILNIPKLLACVLEQDNEFSIPVFIYKYTSYGGLLKNSYFREMQPLYSVYQFYMYDM